MLEITPKIAVENLLLYKYSISFKDINRFYKMIREYLSDKDLYIYVNQERDEFSVVLTQYSDGVLNVVDREKKNEYGDYYREYIVSRRIGSYNYFQKEFFDECINRKFPEELREEIYRICQIIAKEHGLNAQLEL